VGHSKRQPILELIEFTVVFGRPDSNSALPRCSQVCYQLSHLSSFKSHLRINQTMVRHKHKCLKPFFHRKRFLCHKIIIVWGGGGVEITRGCSQSLVPIILFTAPNDVVGIDASSFTSSIGRHMYITLLINRTNIHIYRSFAFFKL
jgi:hypothetical protein